MDSTDRHYIPRSSRVRAVLDLQLDIRLQRGDFCLQLTQSFSLQGITGIVGPSGAGKSSLLRVIAGLESGVQGEIRLDGESWQRREPALFLPTHKRRVGVVFQDSRLFEHLTVANNLTFALKRAAVSHGPSVYDDVVQALGIAPLLNRWPSTLSGGERQRVAIARALLSLPRLLLLDEPLNAVDQEGKRELLRLLGAINRQFKVPMMYVSHAMDELAALTDNTLLLRNGRAIAYTTTPDLMSRLDLHEMSSSATAGSVIYGRVHHYDETLCLTQIMVSSCTLSIPGRVGEVGDELRLRIHARDVALATHFPSGLSIRNIVPATITHIERGAPPYADVLTELDGQTIRARITHAAIEELRLEVGCAVYLLIKAASVESS